MRWLFLRVLIVRLRAAALTALVVGGLLLLAAGDAAAQETKRPDWSAERKRIEAAVTALAKKIVTPSLVECRMPDGSASEHQRIHVLGFDQDHQLIDAEES
ncbi:MAG TPA: hypothetical protein PK264_23475, partial [Hyphomicrobiaceae bacterium]|nr:hypothetical protein [Hyphomicrobiaceae bacterium]